MTNADEDQKVYCNLEVRVSKKVLDRVKAFFACGVSGNVQLNVKDGEILGAHITEITTVSSSQSRHRRTA